MQNATGVFPSEDNAFNVALFVRYVFRAVVFGIAGRWLYQNAVRLVQNNSADQRRAEGGLARRFPPIGSELRDRLIIREQFADILEAYAFVNPEFLLQNAILRYEVNPSRCAAAAA